MEPTIKTDLFELKINSSGKIYIRKFVTIARIGILVSILLSIILIATTAVSSIIFKPSKYSGFKYLLLQRELLPYYTLVLCVILYLHIYFYWQLTKY